MLRRRDRYRAGLYAGSKLLQDGPPRTDRRPRLIRVGAFCCAVFEAGQCRTRALGGSHGAVSIAARGLAPPRAMIAIRGRRNIQRGQTEGGGRIDAHSSFE